MAKNVLLYNARRRRGWTQVRLAVEAGVGLSTVERAERGEPLGLDSIEKLYTCLNQTSEQLGLLLEVMKRPVLAPIATPEADIHMNEKKPSPEQSVIASSPDTQPDLSKASPLEATKLPLETDGCFSFGRIKTTWKILDGDGTSIYLPQHIRSHYIPFAEELPVELEARRNQIREEQEKKKEQGLPFFWNGEAYSLDRFVIGREPVHEDMTLDLWFRPSDYYTFLATNMSLKEPALREKYLSHVDWDEPVPYFSHSFGISLAVVTSDGYTLFTQRGKNVGSLPSTYETSVVEGLSRPTDRGTNGEAPDVYRCACRGLTEELGLHESVDFSVSDITFLSFGVSTQYALWAMRGMVRVKKGIRDLMTRWENGVRDKFENQKIVPVPFTSEDVVFFVFNHPSLSLRPTIYHTLVHEFGREKVDAVISLY